MKLEEIKQKDINKGDIFINAISGRRMLVKSFEKHDRPSIGHYRVFVQEYVPGEISLVPQWYNDINAFGDKVKSAYDSGASSESSQNKSEQATKIENKPKSATKKTMDYAHNQWAKEQLNGVPEDPADEIVRNDFNYDLEDDNH
jgi:hypothetical protein